MKLVMCTGVFDIFHPGHLYHLQAARALGDYLLVGLTADRRINKGPGRPVFKALQRAAVLRELRCVSEVVIYDEAIPYELIESRRPQLYVKGREYEGRLPEQRRVESCGGRVVFTDTQVYSSTALVERL